MIGDYGLGVYDESQLETSSERLILPVVFQPFGVYDEFLGFMMNFDMVKIS